MSTLGGPEDLQPEPAPRRPNLNAASKLLALLVILHATWSALTTSSALLAFLGWVIALAFALGVAFGV